MSVASLTDPGSVIRSSYISDLSSSFRMLSLENVTLAFVDATTTLLRNVVKLVTTSVGVTHYK